MSDCHVLVVDDDPSIRATIAEILDLEGYPVATAKNGEEALASVDREMPHVILLDMRMPVLDGWGFAEAFRARYGTLSPVVVMTAAESAQQWCDEIGANACLPKPFGLDEMLAITEQVCAGTA
jgi:CheY-like chemotaxis protein